jgi:hypothetical protein
MDWMTLLESLEERREISVDDHPELILEPERHDLVIEGDARDDEATLTFRREKG